jgi:hypothetical protein
MNILQSIAGNKTILNIALKQISASMEKDGTTAIIILRDPDNKDEEGAGLFVKTFTTGIGILEGDDLTDYLRYREARENGSRGIGKMTGDDPADMEKEVTNV